jgi:hypothetical protein
LSVGCISSKLKQDSKRLRDFRFQKLQKESILFNQKFSFHLGIRPQHLSRKELIYGDQKFLLLSQYKMGMNEPV